MKSKYQRIFEAVVNNHGLVLSTKDLQELVAEYEDFVLMLTKAAAHEHDGASQPFEALSPGDYLTWECYSKDAAIMG